ncbi:MAG: gamma-glutamyltransferase [Minwuia sp.]|uniref:gamma-glutamyltransferase n=1 Tax=Minwuia sp. TaxID=2493630 RepID=UPI003A89B7FE
MNIETGRPPTPAVNGLVTSPHSLASSAGVDVLRAGGSAVDAAIATSAVLAVLYPHMTSIGGDAFWLIHEGATGDINYLSGGGQAAATADIEWFRTRGHTEIPLEGVLPATLTVPGALASWAAAHERYGRLPLARCLEQAIAYARDGAPVSARVAGFIELFRGKLAAHPDTSAIFLPGGEVPRAGARLANPNLARSMEAFARDGRAGFYEGEVARALSRFAEAQGGFFREGDFAAQQARWEAPLVGTYRGLEIYNTPAPTQGFTVLSMLNLLEPFDLGGMPAFGPDHVHLLVQAKQLAYHDRDRYLGDPRFGDVPVGRLISKAHADERRRLIDPSRALAWDEVPSYGSLSGDTVYMAAVDRDGNAVSLIQSIYGAFGSGVVAGDTGILLQNRGAYFTLDPDHPNALQPGKVPLHTLIASMGKRDGKLWSVLGCMGADGQPQIQLQAYVGLLDHGLDIQQALEAPRFLSGRFGLGESRDTLHMEGRFPDATMDELARRGHTLDRWADWNELAGHAHGILIDPETGYLQGGSDPRSDGAAIGY